MVKLPIVAEGRNPAAELAMVAVLRQPVKPLDHV